MSVLSLLETYQNFGDLQGGPLNNGYIYIGTAGTNPEITSNQLSLFWDVDLAIPAANPVRTINGYLSRSGSPGDIYFTAETYSVTVRDSNLNLVYSNLNYKIRLPLSAFDTQFLRIYPTVDDLRDALADGTLGSGEHCKVIENVGGAGYEGANYFNTRNYTGASDDGGSLIVPAVSPTVEAVGAFENGVNIFQFGLVGDDSTENLTQGTTAMVYAAGKKLKHPGKPTSGTFLFRHNGAFSIPAQTTGLFLDGECVETNRYKQMSTTADALKLLGEADACVLSFVHFQCNTTSSGYGFNSEATAAATPLRDFLFYYSNISGYLRGISIAGGLGDHIVGGRVSGPGVAVANSIGIKLGNSITVGINNGSITNTYTSSYQVCVLVVNCTPCGIKGAIMGPSGTTANGRTLQVIGSSVITISHCYFDGESDYAIENSGGYIALDSCTFSSTGAQVITSSTQRFRQLGGDIPRVDVYRTGGGQTIAPGAPVKIQLNGVTSDSEGDFDAVTNFRYTARRPGTVFVVLAAFINVPELDRDYKIMIYKQGAVVKQANLHGRSGGAAYNRTVYVGAWVYLDQADRIEAYIETNQAGNNTVNAGAIDTFMQIMPH